MNTKGEYRDILSRNGDILMDTGWKSNTIVEDYGKFLAALMKKDFEGQVGIEYMAVGSGSDGAANFKERVKKYFEGKLETNDRWVWVKKIAADAIIYLKEDGVTKSNDPTNKLEITVEFENNEPPGDTSKLTEFALLGIYEDSGTFNTEKMFFINYVGHGLITKYATAKLDRTIILTFPFEEVIS